MKALITGGAGFIGSHLAEALLGAGHDVSIIDDLSTGSIQNIDGLKGHPRFRYVIDSILNQPLLAEVMDPCDVVFHLAASVGVRLIVESPVRTIETNVRGTEVVLACANKKKKRVVVASTSEVYGKSEKLPYSEEDDLVLGPTHIGRWSYACSKAIDEFLSLAYWKEKRLPTVVVRLFNTVGPRQTGQYGMVIPTFVRQALLGHRLTVFGDGQQRRCFCDVGDVVGALIALAQHDAAIGRVFNIGGTEEISMLGLADRIKAKTRSTSEIVLVPYSEAYEEGFEDMRRRIPDISRIKAAVGYQPTQSLDQILDRVIEHISTSI